MSTSWMTASMTRPSGEPPNGFSDRRTGLKTIPSSLPSGVIVVSWKSKE